MWRETARAPRLAGIDARALFPLSVWLLHWSWETFYVAAAGVGIAVVLELYGYTPMVLWRLVRTRAAGRRRPAAAGLTVRRSRRRARW